MQLFSFLKQVLEKPAPVISPERYIQEPKFENPLEAERLQEMTTPERIIYLRRKQNWTTLEHLDGIPWFEAAPPRRRHKCWAQLIEED